MGKNKGRRTQKSMGTHTGRTLEEMQKAAQKEEEVVSEILEIFKREKMTYRQARDVSQRLERRLMRISENFIENASVKELIENPHE